MNLSGPMRAIGLCRGGHQLDDVIVGGEIIAGIAYENWNGASMTCHMKVTGRLTREFLWANAAYSFLKCGVRKLIAPIADDNGRMMALAIKMGFQEEARIRDAHPNGDILLFTLTKENCRFLDEKWRPHGQANTAPRS
jgi:L-amino acid N-acyltransferase YncA